MTFKKIAGYIIIVIAALLTLAILGQIQKIFKAFTAMFLAVIGKLGMDEFGYFLGNFLYWIT
jgi:hypothetical protein